MGMIRSPRQKDLFIEFFQEEGNMFQGEMLDFNPTCNFAWTCMD